MECALGVGRNAAMGVAIGIACGSFLWAITTTMGLGYVVNEYPTIVSILGIIGGGYFIKLGITRCRSSREKIALSCINPVLRTSLQGDVLHGTLVISIVA